MPYLWTKTSEIQVYLDKQGTIQIQVDDSDDQGKLAKGETFKLDSAEQLENEAVYEVVTFLTMAFAPDPDEADVGNDDDSLNVDIGIYGPTPLGLLQVGSADGIPGILCPHYLRLLVAKFTAAKIGIVRVGSGLGNLPHWITEFENDVFAQLRRLVVNAETIVSDLNGLKLRNDYDLAVVLMKMKTRSRAVIDGP
ncbi:hypothetical protein F4Z99_18625 [Candidatus Poribacteria bacterium]|nr:hypothetical protein [Candidatus Poribacteria bacterium]